MGHWISSGDEEYDDTFETDWYKDGPVNDKYCCNYNPGKKCSRNVLILHTEKPAGMTSTGADSTALWYSQNNCKASCSSDLTCNFYMYRSEGSLKTCATFRTCKKKKNRMNFGNDGTSCVYKKNQG